MKKCIMLLLTMSLCILAGNNIRAQYAKSWSEVIAEEKGDTVVVKGYESSLLFNTLLTAVKGDTTASGERVNPNRVYETIPGETYISDVTLELDVRVPFLHITAPEPPPGVKPPLHIRALTPTGVYDKTLFQTPGNTLYENQYFLMAFLDEQLDREFMRATAPNTHHEWRNCVFELTNWTHALPLADQITFKYTDCKFINVGNEPTLEKGCVMETRETPPDTVWMENCTFLNGGILILGLNDTGPNYVYFNHNTVVNCLQPPVDVKTAAEMIVTNNIFVNTGIVADYPGFYPLIDDDDDLPKGLINIDTMEGYWLRNWYLDADGNSFYPIEEKTPADTMYPIKESERKVLFANNSYYWDPRFEDMIENKMPPIPADIGDYEWNSQMIVMNDRTQAMFDDDASYPYLNEGDNWNIKPDFVKNKDLVDEWVSFVVTNSTPGLPNGGDPMPKWRTNWPTNVYTPDWPMLANLAYTEPQLIRAGINEYPLGDLNWFSKTKKNNWKNTKETEKLWEALQAGELPEDWAVAGIKDNHISTANLTVYPNPFSKMTNVEFDIKGSAQVDIVIYNLVGEKVKSLDLGYLLNGKHNITVELSDLNSGMYMLQLNVENQGQVSTRIAIK